VQDFKTYLDVASTIVTIIATLVTLRLDRRAAGHGTSVGNSGSWFPYRTVMLLVVVGAIYAIYRYAPQAMPWNPNHARPTLTSPSSMVLSPALRELDDAAEASGLHVRRDFGWELTLDASRLSKFDVEHWTRMARSQNFARNETNQKLLSVTLKSVDGTTLEPPKISYSANVGTTREVRTTILASGFDAAATTKMASVLAQNLRNGTEHTSIPYAKPD